MRDRRPHTPSSAHHRRVSLLTLLPLFIVVCWQWRLLLLL